MCQLEVRNVGFVRGAQQVKTKMVSAFISSPLNFGAIEKLCRIGA
jgi:hypothetical protein